MTNTFRNYFQRLVSNVKQRGAATLVAAVVLIITTTLIVMFAANNSRVQTTITGNINRNAQAYSAAEAGIGYGINYLLQNATTITGSPSGGYINYTTGAITNVTLANNSKYSIVYTNPIINNYSIIKITSTGRSDDDSSTRVIEVQVRRGSLITNIPSVSLTSKGNINLSGNGHVTNTTTNETIKSAQNVAFSGNAYTTVSSGNSSSAYLGVQSDVQANNTVLANTSQNDLFASYFGTTDTSSIRSQSNLTFTNSSSTNYTSSLDGQTGKTIWIDQTGGTASISGNATIGSAANPVLLIVNGSFSMSGNVTVYGLIYVMGDSGMTTSLTGNLGIQGTLITTDNTNISGNSNITYNPTILTILQNNSFAYWARIPGTWKDY